MIYSTAPPHPQADKYYYMVAELPVPGGVAAHDPVGEVHGRDRLLPTGGRGLAQATVQAPLVLVCLQTEEY